jgi:hypothetical protein
MCIRWNSDIYIAYPFLITLAPFKYYGKYLNSQIYLSFHIDFTSPSFASPFISNVLGVLSLCLNCAFFSSHVIIWKIKFGRTCSSPKRLVLCKLRIWTDLFVVCKSFQPRSKTNGPLWMNFSCALDKWKSMLLYPNLNYRRVTFKPVHRLLNEPFFHKLPIILKMKNIWGWNKWVDSINSN